MTDKMNTMEITEEKTQTELLWDMVSIMTATDVGKNNLKQPLLHMMTYRNEDGTWERVIPMTSCAKQRGQMMNATDRIIRKNIQIDKMRKTLEQRKAQRKE